MSWVGHNIFGNRDGLVLDDPANKASKVETKDRVVTEILGYKPSSLVTIEYLPDMGDWKTAWDHIHFQGFLGTKMTLQFTWQGCDSLLAAPLAIDLARLADLEKQRGGKRADEPPRLLLQEPRGRRGTRLLQAIHACWRGHVNQGYRLMQLAFSTNAYLKHPVRRGRRADRRARLPGARAAGRRAARLAGRPARESRSAASARRWSGPGWRSRTSTRS